MSELAYPGRSIPGCCTYLTICPVLFDTLAAASVSKRTVPINTKRTVPVNTKEPSPLTQNL